MCHRNSYTVFLYFSGGYYIQCILTSLHLCGPRRFASDLEVVLRPSSSPMCEGMENLDLWVSKTESTHIIIRYLTWSGSILKEAPKSTVLRWIYGAPMGVTWVYSIYLSVCLSIYLSIYLSIDLSICLSVCLSLCLSVCLSICLSVCLSICLSVYLSVYLSVCLAVWLSVCLSVCLWSNCISIYLPVYWVQNHVCLSWELTTVGLCMHRYAITRLYYYHPAYFTWHTQNMLARPRSIPYDARFHVKEQIHC